MCFFAMLLYFFYISIDILIEYVFIEARGKEEVGRGDGVARDIYSGFWIDVSNSLFIGEKERVSFVRHDLYKRE